MPRRSLVPLVLPLLLFAATAAAQTHPVGFDDVLVVGGLSEPTTLAMTPAGKLLVGLRGGQIRVVDHGVLSPKPMLTLSVETYEEEGLIGMALDPQFATQPYLYVFWSPFTGAQPVPTNRVSRFTVNADTVVAGSEVVLLSPVPTGAGWHQGGCLRTTSDGKLWIGIGDTSLGGTFGWTRMNDHLEGKLLRLNLDGSIPASNPFVGVPGARGEIWQKGLRNPFRFTLQPGTQQPFIDDVGENLWEEIDRGAPGADFGWPNYEGITTPQPSGVTNPIYAYSHSGGGASITGCTFYAGTQFPAAYQGNLFFLEHSRGQIGRMILDGSNNVVSVTMPWGTTASAGWGSGPVDLLLGNEGALYYTQYSGGQVRKITYGPQTGVEPSLSGLAFAPPGPNPARGETALRFSLAAPGRAKLAVYDAQGRLVRMLADGAFAAGPHAQVWDGADDGGRLVPAGLYLARLEADGRALVRRVVRLR